MATSSPARAVALVATTLTVPRCGRSHLSEHSANQGDFAVTASPRRALYPLLVGAALAVGTPAYLGITRAGMAGYLLHPLIFGVLVLPYLVAALLWLPWRTSLAGEAEPVLAGLLCFAAVVLYVPMITGLWRTGGDMVGLGFLLIGLVTTACVVFATIVASIVRRLRDWMS